jgi:hypothetical protein
MAKGFINITNVGDDHYMLVKLPKLQEKLKIDPSNEKVPIEIKVMMAHRGAGSLSICCDGACCNGLKNSDWAGMRITEM